MKFTCPLCEATGGILEDDLAHPVTRTTCRNCGAILLLNPDTGKVDAHKSPLKDASIKTPLDRATGEPPPVLSTRSKDPNARDWTAPVVVAIILIGMICAGVYVVVNLNII